MSSKASPAISRDVFAIIGEFGYRFDNFFDNNSLSGVVVMAIAVEQRNLMRFPAL
jgi:hypothetical protein